MPRSAAVFSLLTVWMVLLDHPAGAAPTNFYTLSERWEKSAKSSFASESDSLDHSFSSALLQKNSLESPVPEFTIPASPPIRKSLEDIASAGNFVQVEANQSLFVRASSAITKFVYTDEGFVALDTPEEGVLRVTGLANGRTFVHVWSSEGRRTFEVQVLPQTFRPSAERTAQIEEYQRSRSFKINYEGNRSTFYTGSKFSDKRRSSLDLTQNLGVEGDSPYGGLSADVQTQKSADKTIVTSLSGRIKDGRIGGLDNFNATLADADVTPAFMVFPGARVRGGSIDHWNDPKTLETSHFYGREQSSIIGTLSPGVVSKRTRDSFLSGNSATLKVNENATLRGGIFTGHGQSRADTLNRVGEAAAASVKLGPHVRLAPEIGHDDQQFAMKNATFVNFEKLRMRSEVRDIHQDFVTLIGAPARQGEKGYLFDVSADPFDNLNLAGSIDIFRDRLVPNPEDVQAYNVHTDLSMSTRPWESASLSMQFQDYDDTGRIGPTRQRNFGVQFNQTISDWFNHKYVVFSRYNHRRNRNITTPVSDYVQNQAVVGLRTQLFWDLGFTIEQEMSHLDEPNFPRITHPHATNYILDYARQIGKTPFYMDMRLRIRDEEDTESTNSFMSGEDSTELSGNLYYREFENMEIYVSGSFQNYVPESLNVLEPRIEAQLVTGMRYILDTGFRWSPTGSFKGSVYKDSDGDGKRSSDEKGLAGVLVKASDGSQAVTDEQGHFELGPVSGHQTVISVDSGKIPYGYAATTAVSEERPILQGQTQEISFGFTPRSEVTGIVFNDLNGSGAYEAGVDTGVRKVKIQLETGAVARSNQNGVYAFPNVTAGDHTASLDFNSLPEGYLPVSAGKKAFTLFEGMRYELHFPVRAARTVTGRVFIDKNRNGLLEADEAPLEGIRVSLAGQTVTTDRDGWYLFENLVPGTHELQADGSAAAGRPQMTGRMTIVLTADPVTYSDKNVPMAVAEETPTPTLETPSTSGEQTSGSQNIPSY